MTRGIKGRIIEDLGGNRYKTHEHKIRALHRRVKDYGD